MYMNSRAPQNVQMGGLFSKIVAAVTAPVKAIEKAVPALKPSNVIATVKKVDPLQVVTKKITGNTGSKGALQLFQKFAPEAQVLKKVYGASGPERGYIAKSRMGKFAKIQEQLAPKQGVGKTIKAILDPMTAVGKLHDRAANVTGGLRARTGFDKSGTIERWVSPGVYLHRQGGPMRTTGYTPPGAENDPANAVPEQDLTAPSGVLPVMRQTGAQPDEGQYPDDALMPQPPADDAGASDTPAPNKAATALKWGAGLMLLLTFVS